MEWGCKNAVFYVREERLSFIVLKERETVFLIQHGSKNAVFYVREDRLSSYSSKREKLFSESRMRG